MGYGRVDPSVMVSDSANSFSHVPALSYRAALVVARQHQSSVF